MRERSLSTFGTTGRTEARFATHRARSTTDSNKVNKLKRNTIDKSADSQTYSQSHLDFRLMTHKHEFLDVND